MKQVLLAIILALTLGCSPGRKESRCIITAFTTSNGQMHSIDSWGCCTKPWIMPDGTTQFWNYFSETLVTLPPGVQVSTEESIVTVH